MTDTDQLDESQFPGVADFTGPAWLADFADQHLRSFTISADTHFTGVAGLNLTGLNFHYQPPVRIPGTASRGVRLDRTRLGAQVTALLRQPNPTT